MQPVISSVVKGSYINSYSIDSCISHDEFISVNNVLREHYEMKQKIKNHETSVEYTIYIKKIETFCASCKKYAANENSSAR